MKKALITIGYITLIYVVSGLGIAGEYWLSNLWHLSFNGMTWLEANLHMFGNPFYLGAMILILVGFIPYVSWKLAASTVELMEMDKT